MILSLAQIAQRFAPKHVGRFGLNPHGILAVQVIIIVVALFIIWWLLRSRAPKYDKSLTPLQILDRRYAAGEITEQDYKRIKKDLD